MVLPNPMPAECQVCDAEIDGGASFCPRCDPESTYYDPLIRCACGELLESFYRESEWATLDIKAALAKRDDEPDPSVCDDCRIKAQVAAWRAGR